MTNKTKNGKKTKTLSGKGKYSEQLPPPSRANRAATAALHSYLPTATTGTWQNNIAQMAGGALGGYLAGPGGAVVGRFAGDAFARYKGYGKYSIKSNSIMKNVERNVPSMHSNKECVVVRHREYLGDIISNATIGALTTQTFALNPGIFTTFPFLAQIASNYQEYKWRGMVFEFETNSGSVTSSQALGTVLMCTQYRASAPTLVTKFSILNEYFASDTVPSESAIHPVECDPKQSPYQIHLIRTGAISNLDSINEFDWGNFTIGSVGLSAASVNLGELWCSYEVELYKPCIYGSLGAIIPTFHYQLNTVTASNPLGTTQTVKFDNIGVSFLSSTTIGFPATMLPGVYNLQFQYTGGSTACTNPVITINNGETADNVWKLSAGNLIGTPNGTTTVTLEGSLYVNLPTPTLQGTQMSIVFGTGGTLPTGVTSADVIFTMCNSNLTS